ncbi:MAG: hypothetical protein JSV16_06665 [Candidatus Hydrogenedentota bacterium]|nr:MAG: hypothetical protein JSV16_06665 [Candidatus Hydrogenedentota bacterium]
MKIKHIELYHAEIPLEEPFKPSWVPAVSYACTLWQRRRTANSASVLSSPGLDSRGARWNTCRKYWYIDSEGFVHVPEGSGLGIVIDEEKFRKFGEKFFGS